MSNVVCGNAVDIKCLLKMWKKEHKNGKLTSESLIWERKKKKKKLSQCLIWIIKTSVCENRWGPVSVHQYLHFQCLLRVKPPQSGTQRNCAMTTQSRLIKSRAISEILLDNLVKLEVLFSAPVLSTYYKQRWFLLQKQRRSFCVVSLSIFIMKKLELLK